MTRIAHLTNATKAQIVLFINTALALLVAFGLNLSDTQTAAITAFVNAALSLWVALTYRNSPKRVRD